MTAGPVHEEQDIPAQGSC